MTKDDWAEADSHLLACEADRAVRRVREITGDGPEEAAESVRRRFLFLRTARPGDFAWTAFSCDDYIRSDLADRGFWDDASQMMVIEPAWKLRLRGDIDLLAVGRPGVDGIEFGYRKGHSGVWAYYPIDNRFVPVAATVQALVDGWLSGRLTV